MKNINADTIMKNTSNFSMREMLHYQVDNVIDSKPHTMERIADLYFLLNFMNSDCGIDMPGREEMAVSSLRKYFSKSISTKPEVAS